MSTRCRVYGWQQLVRNPLKQGVRQMTDKQCSDEWESEDLPQPEENEFTVWQPVARDLEFEKHIAKLKAMKQFNEGR